MVTRRVSFEVAHFHSREATAAYSLGRQPKVSPCNLDGSREAAAAFTRFHCCRRFAAKGLTGYLIPMRTHGATCCRHYVASKCATSRRVSEGFTLSLADASGYQNASTQELSCPIVGNAHSRSEWPQKKLGTLYVSPASAGRILAQ